MIADVNVEAIDIFRQYQIKAESLMRDEHVAKIG